MTTKEDRIDNLMKWALEILVILIVCFSVFVVIKGVLDMNYNFDDYCKLKYGENYTYRNVLDFGMFCSEVFINNLTYGENHLVTYKEMDDFCKSPRLFDLTKWKNKCSQ